MWIILNFLISCSSKNGVSRKEAASSACNPNDCTHVFPQDSHSECSRSAFSVFSHFAIQNIKESIRRNWDLIKFTFYCLITDIFSETVHLCYCACVVVRDSTVWCCCLDLCSGISILPTVASAPSVQLLNQGKGLITAPHY